jgi:hypothetical protein
MFIPHVASTSIGMGGGIDYVDPTESSAVTGYSEQTTRVALTMAIRDQFKAPELSQWLGKGFGNYIKIFVLQVRDAIARGQLILGKRDGPQAFLERVNTLKAEGHIAEGDAQVFSLKDIVPALADGEAPVDFQLIFESNMIKDSAGNMLYELQHPVIFEGLPERPLDLSYVVFSFVDFEALNDEFDGALNVPTAANAEVVDLDVGGGQGVVKIHKDLMDGIRFENVFKNSALVTQGTVYFTGRGNVWDGPIHFVDGQAKSGYSATTATNPITLAATTTSNTKIQDFRVRNTISLPDLNIDLAQLFPSTRSPVKNASYETSVAGLFSMKPESVSIVDYFSDVFLSQHKNESIMGTFFIDFEKILLRESRFPVTLLGNKKGDVLSASKILGFNLLRRKVYGNESSADDKSPFFNNSEVKLASTKDEGVALVSVTPNGLTEPWLEEEFIYAEGGTTTREVRSFSFNDKSASKNTKYSYGVEFILEDGTVSKVKAQVTALKALMIMLEELRAALDIKENLIKGTKQLTSGALTTFSADINGVSATLTSRLHYIFELFRGRNPEYIDAKQVEITQKLSFLLNNIDGMTEVLALLSRVHSTLEGVISNDVKGWRGAAQDDTTFQALSTKRLLTFKHYFSSAGSDVATQEIKDYYLDVLSLDRDHFNIPNIHTVKNVPVLEYNARANMEKSKFFHEDAKTIWYKEEPFDTDIDATKLSYLTPTIVANHYFGQVTPLMQDMEGVPLETVSASDASITNALLNWIKTSRSAGTNTGFGGLGNLSGPQQAIGENNAVETLAADLAGATRIQKEPLETVMNQAIDNALTSPVFVADPTLGKEPVSSPPSEIVFPHTSIHDVAETESLYGNVDLCKFVLFKYITLLESILKYIPSNLSFDFQEYNPGVLGTMGFGKLPLSLKSLFATADAAGVLGGAKSPAGFSGGNISNKVLKGYKKTAGVFWFHQNIYKVEYLKEFGTTADGFRTIKNLEWTLLDSAALAPFGTLLAGGRVLCRISLYEGPMAIPMQEKLQMPISDQIFILQRPGVSAGGPVLGGAIGQAPIIPADLGAGEASSTEDDPDEEDLPTGDRATGGGYG